MFLVFLSFSAQDSFQMRVLYPTLSCTRAAIERIMVEVATKDSFLSYCLSLDPHNQAGGLLQQPLNWFSCPNLTSSSFSSSSHHLQLSL